MVHNISHSYVNNMHAQHTILMLSFTLNTRITEQLQFTVVTPSYKPISRLIYRCGERCDQNMLDVEMYDDRRLLTEAADSGDQQ